MPRHLAPRPRPAQRGIALTAVMVASGVGTWAFTSLPSWHRTTTMTTIAIAMVTTVATTTTTTTTTTSTSTTTTQPPNIVIHGVGDVNFDTDYIRPLAIEGFDYAFSGLDGLFLQDDVTVINLECAPSPLGEPVGKEYDFSCNPDGLPYLASNGVEVASLGNNHSRDRGPEALIDGRRRLAEAGVAPVGAGKDLAEATEPALFQIQGRTVAVVGFGGVINGWEWIASDTNPGMASGDDIELMAATVARAAELADVVVVTIHWGRELETEPDAQDRARAEAMIAAGADMIFGHHPHRLGRLEWIDGRPVFWTLGNFIWQRTSDAAAATAVARVVIGPDGSIVACMISASIVKSGHPELLGDPGCPDE